MGAFVESLKLIPPEASLKRARSDRDQARERLSQKIDPSQHRRTQKYFKIQVNNAGRSHVH